MAIHQQEVIVFLPNHIDYLVTFFFHRVDEAVGEVIIKSYILILGASSVISSVPEPAMIQLRKIADESG